MSNTKKDSKCIPQIFQVFVRNFAEDFHKIEQRFINSIQNQYILFLGFNINFFKRPKKFIRFNHYHEEWSSTCKEVKISVNHSHKFHVENIMNKAIEALWI